MFFDKKQVYYDKMKEESKGAKKAKQALIEKAESLKHSTDWKDYSSYATAAKGLEKCGSCPPSENTDFGANSTKPRPLLQYKKSQFAGATKRKKPTLNSKKFSKKLRLSSSLRIELTTK